MRLGATPCPASAAGHQPLPRCRAKHARLPVRRGVSSTKPPPPLTKARRDQNRDVATAVVADDAPAYAEQLAAPQDQKDAPYALTSKALGVERGQTLPPVPGGRVHWVDDVSGIGLMRDAVMDPSRNPTTKEGHPPVVGMDGEWKPGSRTPVSILQIATRTDAFVVDLFAVARRESPDDAREAFDNFLHELLQSETVYKLGFSFGYDLTRLKASYPHLASLRTGGQPKGMIDVKQLAHSASANRSNLRVGLATLTKMVVGATLSKAEQCSDWSRRPLTRAQLEYAAADAFYLNLIFDKCIEKSHGGLLKSLDDIVLMGDPRAKGKHLPRKAKKALKKQAALAARLTTGADFSGGGFGSAGAGSGRRPDVEEVSIDLVAVLPGVGQATTGGRKGVAKFLSRDKDVPRFAKRGGAVERWGNAVVLFLSVGTPGRATRGVGQFWEETAGGDVFFIPDQASLDGADAAVAQTPLQVFCTGKQTGNAFRCDDRTGAAEGTAGTDTTASGKDPNEPKEALLFMRRPPGNFVFCGRLEPTDDADEKALRLVDANALRGGSAFHQLVGCRLRDGKP